MQILFMEKKESLKAISTLKIHLTKILLRQGMRVSKTYIGSLQHGKRTPCKLPTHEESKTYKPCFL